MYVTWFSIVCTSDVAPGQNAPKGVEKMPYECRIYIESNDWGNNTLYSALSRIS